MRHLPPSWIACFIEVICLNSKAKAIGSRKPPKDLLQGRKKYKLTKLVLSLWYFQVATSGVFSILFKG
jgi:hypothetical protein